MLVSAIDQGIWSQTSNADYLYGILMINFKICLLLHLNLLFRMKKIEITLNLDGEDESQLLYKFKKLVHRARLFLLIFLLDILVYVILIFYSIYNKG